MFRWKTRLKEIFQISEAGGFSDLLSFQVKFYVLHLRKTKFFFVGVPAGKSQQSQCYYINRVAYMIVIIFNKFVK